MTDPDARRPLIEAAARRPLIEAAARRWGRTDIAAVLAHSPLIVLTVDGDAPPDRGQDSRP